MREGVSVAYLLARLSDTLADAEGHPHQARQVALQEYAAAVASLGPVRHVIPEAWIATSGAIPGERELLRRTSDLLAWLQVLDPAQQLLVREVLATIISGQFLDLERFAGAAHGTPVALTSAAELDDYAYRVAGSVGEFWTKLGYLTMAGRFSQNDEDAMIALGIRFGKGLQLVNILRDAIPDRAAGRIYLPVSGPSDQALLECHREWHEIARGHVAAGHTYAAHQPQRRARAATLLPALLADDTLELLAQADLATLATKPKVGRGRVYRQLARALLFSPRPD